MWLELPPGTKKEAHNERRGAIGLAGQVEETVDGGKKKKK